MPGNAIAADRRRPDRREDDDYQPRTRGARAQPAERETDGLLERRAGGKGGGGGGGEGLQSGEEEDDDVALKQSCAVVCILIFLVNTFMMLWAIHLNASGTARSFAFEPIATNPMLGPAFQVLFDLGAKDTDMIVKQGQVWRLFLGSQPE